MVNINSSEGSGIPQGIILPSDALNNMFLLMEEIPSPGYNRLVKAQRYGRFFMLKALKDDVKDDPLYQGLLRKEFELGIQMNHPNILRLYNLEDVPGLGLSIVCEYIDGQPLDRFFGERPSFVKKQRVLRQVLDGMEYFHSLKIVHRDLKPANILVTHHGNMAKIIDFGLADSDDFAILKEPAFSRIYASPEQLEGAPLDYRTDIFSFGRILQTQLPHRHKLVAFLCTRRRRACRIQSVALIRTLIAGAWRQVLALLLMVAILVFGWMGARSILHYNSEPFAFTTAEGLDLECQIIDNQVHILNGADEPMPLVIPQKIQYRWRKFPVTHIENDAFLEHDSLTAIQLPEGLLSIGHNAFNGCCSVPDTIIIPESVLWIGDNAFDQCTHITTVIIRSRKMMPIDTIEPKGLFKGCLHLDEVIFDTTVREIRPSLLYYCYRHVHTLTFSPQITSLPNSAFAETYAIRTIHWPDSLCTIETGAFFGCGLPRIEISGVLQEIGSYAFACCFNCTYAEFGPSLKKISSNSFYRMEKLDTLIFHSIVPPEHKDDPFDRTKPRHLLVPAESLELYLADSIYARYNPEPLK